MKSFESRLTIFLSYSFIQRARARARSFVIVSLHLPLWAGEKRRGNAKTYRARIAKEEVYTKRPGATRKYEEIVHGGNTGTGGSEGIHEYIQRNASHGRTSVALGKGSRGGVP